MSSPAEAKAQAEAKATLDELHARIEDLEAVLAGAPVRVRTALPRSPWRLLGLALVAGGIGALAARAMIGPKDVVVLGLGPPAPIVPGGLELADGAPPQLIDIDGDGAKDLVVRAWRPGQDRAPLHVVAIDRKTYAVKWRAGPFPAEAGDRGRLAVAGGHVVVADTHGVAHVLDARTGREQRTVDLHERVRELRVIPDAPQHLLVAFSTTEGYVSRHELAFLDFDFVSGYPTTDVPPASESARRRLLQCEGTGDPSVPCAMGREPYVDPKVKAFYPTHEFVADVEANGESFTRVDLRAGVGPGKTEHAMVTTDDGKTLKWKAALVPSTRVWAPYPNTTPEGRTALASGRIYHLYPTVRGEQRLAARSLETGVLEYDVAVPWLDYGSAVDAVSAESGEMFIVANQSLFVIEGATGQLKKTIVTL